MAIQGFSIFLFLTGTVEKFVRVLGAYFTAYTMHEAHAYVQEERFGDNAIAGRGLPAEEDSHARREGVRACIRHLTCMQRTPAMHVISICLA